jgi:uncharacterized protein (TIGR02271 family)
MVIPVVKEGLKIEKQFVLTEELHISKRTVEERHAETVVLRQEEAEVERIDGAGNRVGPEDVLEREPSVKPSRKRESLLGSRPMLPVRNNKILKDD